MLSAQDHASTEHVCGINCPLPPASENSQYNRAYLENTDTLALPCVPGSPFWPAGPGLPLGPAKPAAPFSPFVPWDPGEKRSEETDNLGVLGRSCFLQS